MGQFRIVRGAVAFAALLVCAPLAAQEKTGIKPGFALRPGTARIVLMRPTILVGAQSIGGVNEPNADWTRQARENIALALRQAQANVGNAMVEYDEGASGEGPLATEYAQLFGALADSVIEYQFFAGNRLPTKKRNDSFEWSIGADLGKLRSLAAADYALFITTRDDYGSAGRKVLQMVAAMGGVGLKSGDHTGYAGLVDLRTGELVWLNADRQMGGDVRTAEGASKRVSQLLEGFPGKSSAAVNGAP
ncbi:hypothetical protein HL653_18920 [Sphingomonas sp. AP4-R1]|uniref:hypothetical protein n=1 Tax=Sphingomonas sp. AP4-R1 TaxID=2735134 RepID=UPI0014935B3F|nr:hypothetical protein [Sphingomonas sp. AP4-R1]QJU59552.1 hypothetical protein HL653_18920 [Sphingomonas sp. AP4-R1]